MEHNLTVFLVSRTPGHAQAHLFALCIVKLFSAYPPIDKVSKVNWWCDRAVGRKLLLNITIVNICLFGYRVIKKRIMMLTSHCWVLWDGCWRSVREHVRIESADDSFAEHKSMSGKVRVEQKTFAAFIMIHACMMHENALRIVSSSAQLAD